MKMMFGLAASAWAALAKAQRDDGNQGQPGQANESSPDDNCIPAAQPHTATVGGQENRKAESETKKAGQA